MDFADILLNRFDGEAEMKMNNSALVCFSALETGRVLSRLATRIIRSKSQKSSITLLYLIDKAEENRHTEDMDEYKNNIISDLVPAEERNLVTLRLFIQSSDDYHTEILRISEEQQCSLILLGIEAGLFCTGILKRYGQLKNDPANSDTFIFEQFEKKQVEALKNVHTLFSRTTVSTGMFIDNGITHFRKLFVPILRKNDIHVFTYLYRIAQQENVKIMVWDAIGITQSDPKVQKLFQFIVKKTEGSIYLWNNDKKIECDFIMQQDLIVIGVEGWNKLICTPLPWTDCLPSTLIVKETSNLIQL